MDRNTTNTHAKLARNVYMNYVRQSPQTFGFEMSFACSKRRYLPTDTSSKIKPLTDWPKSKNRIWLLHEKYVLFFSDKMHVRGESRSPEAKVLHISRTLTQFHYARFRLSALLTRCRAYGHTG